MKNGKAVALVAAGLAAGLTLGALGVASAASTLSTDTPGPGGRGMFIGKGFGARGFGGMMRGGAGLVGTVARLTGLDESDVLAQRQAGKSLTEIAKAKGVSADKVVAEALDQATTLLDAQVKAGTITDEQREQFLANLETRLEDEMTHTGRMGPGRGMGGRGFGGMMRGGSMFGAPSCSTTYAPSLRVD